MCAQKFYSQNGEDYLVWKFFAGRTHGFYVDVGGFDGVHLSNTYFFEKKGWSGICVEPHPSYFPLCQKSRPQATCLNVACTAHADMEKVEFFVEDMGLLSGTNVSTRVDDIRQRYKDRGLTFDGLQREVVQAATLSNILEEHLPLDVNLDYLSIDVEGGELDVLAGANIPRYRPRVIVVEADSPEARRKLNNYMKEEFGYIMARHVGSNVFFATDPKDAKRLASIPIRCRIATSLHPLGPRYTLASHLKGKVIREAPLFVSKWLRAGAQLKNKFRRLRSKATEHT